jgi:hypothetical protein
VLHVPSESNPPVLVPDTRTEMVPEEGTPVGAGPGSGPSEVSVGPRPGFGAYLISVSGQLPGVGALILT